MINRFVNKIINCIIGCCFGLVHLDHDSKQLFDEETSTFQVRIIGIAPVLETFDENGNFIGDETMYWIYYPDLRPILAKYEAYNPGNNAVRLSWEDIFEARLFGSYVFKEDNVYDRVIQEYAAGLDALFESDNIKQKIFEFEHDLWSY